MQVQSPIQSVTIQPNRRKTYMPDEAIQSFFAAMDCFAKPVIGLRADPLARNDDFGTCRWGNGPRSALQASRACYGAIGWRASRGLLGGRAVVPHIDGVTESEG